MAGDESKDGSVLEPTALRRYDLTSKLSEYLDRHLVLPLLEFLSLKEIYPEKDLLNAKYDLLKATSMIDFANQIYKQINDTDDDAPEFVESRTAVLQVYEDLQEKSADIMNIIQDPTVIQQLKQDKLANVKFLEDNYSFRPEMLTALYDYARVQYQVGNYSGAAEMLYHFRILSTDFDMNINSLWGKFAAEILTQNWETALEDLNRLKEAIERSTASNSEQLLQRTWLIHWSLFVFFNHPKGRDYIVDLLFQPNYINSIETACPWILRYLTAAVITNKRRRTYLKDLVKVIQQESVSYRDPVTEFVESLYARFDFEGAQRKLAECDEVLACDFFLVSTRADFVENARLLIFETYCRIHQCIDIRGLSAKLNLNEADGEKWIVNLVRNARMDAKIDSETNTVMMGAQYNSVYQQVIERTRALSFRSSLLASNIEKRENELQNRRLGGGGAGQAAHAGGGDRDHRRRDGDRDGRRRQGGRDNRGPR
ncbi:Eukaryotic translation initiation factor 3 subunit E [Cladochytrium tenue]|nr:Eukaryotic translation initiation factor 3 subunit E [Cladochytrium tenue]